MRARVAAVLVLVLVLAVLPTVHASGATPSVPASVSSLPQTTLTASASQTQATKLYWNQTGSPIYAGRGTHILNSFDMTQPFNTTIASSEVVTQSPNSTNLARLNAHQGATVLSNSTLSQVTVGPAVSATKVNVSLVTMTTSAGAALASGKSYTDNVTTVATIDFARDYATTWTYLAPSYAATFYNNASNGFWVNASVFVVPLPAIALNLSSIAATVTTGTTTVTGAYSLSGSNVVVSEAPIAPDTSTMVVVTARALVVGSAVPVPTVTLPAGGAGNYGSLVAGAIYTDSKLPAYDGIFLVNFASGQTVNTVNVTLSINGVALKPAQFTVTTTTITVLPGVYTIYEGEVANFAATWYAPTGAPTAALAGYGTLVAPGLSFGNAVGIAAIALVALALASVALDRSLGGTPEQRFEELLDFGPGKRKASPLSWELGILAFLMVVFWAGLALQSVGRI